MAQKIIKLNKVQLIRLLKEEIKSSLQEKAPPGMEDVVMALKKKYPPEKAFAIAWAQYNKKHKENEEAMPGAMQPPLSPQVSPASVGVGEMEELDEVEKWIAGAIHPSKKGEFTRKAKENGMSVKQYAAHVLSQAHKGSWKGDEKTIAQAKFAKAMEKK